MPIARFYIKEKNRDGVCLIFLRFYCKPRQLTLSTGCHVRPADWNEKTQRVRKTDPNADSINAVIDGMAEDVTSAEKKLKAAKKAVTPEAVRAMVEKSPETRANADVAAFARTHFDDVKSKINMKNREIKKLLKALALMKQAQALVNDVAAKDEASAILQMQDTETTEYMPPYE